MCVIITCRPSWVYSSSLVLVVGAVYGHLFYFQFYRKKVVIIYFWPFMCQKMEAICSLQKVLLEIKLCLV